MKSAATIFLLIFTLALFYPTLSSILKNKATICFSIDEEKTNSQNAGKEDSKKDVTFITSNLASSLKTSNNKVYNSENNNSSIYPFLGILTPPPDYS